MKLRLFIFICMLGGFLTVSAQQDSARKTTPDLADYDELFDELDAFLDSLLAPKSYRLINVSAGTAVFDYTANSAAVISNRQWVVSPAVGFLDKSGWGVQGAASIVNSRSRWLPYQFTATASYDYLKNVRFVTGISATHFFTRDSLPFYVSPLKNEVAAYFSYRAWWVKPAVTASYGWGSRTEVEKRQEKINRLRFRKKASTEITTQERMSDFIVTASVRHDFYWLHLFSNKDFIRFTPQVNITAGTQMYGFNQSYNLYGIRKVTGNSVLFQSDNISLDEHRKFQPLALAALLKSELSVGNFFIQPQAVFSCYLPAEVKNITTTFLINTGCIF